MRKLQSWLACVALFCAAGVASSHAAIFSDFEPPTYTSNTVINGVDGWTGTGNAVVTPYGFGETYGSGVLEGTQSLWMLIDYERRLWSNSVIPDLINTNSTEISWLLSRPTGFGRSMLYLWDSLSAANTPAGLGMGTNGNFEVYASGATDTGVSYQTNKTYRLGMVFDFTNNTFLAYAENVTDSGPRQYLGTYQTLHVGAWNLTDLRNGGGIWLWDYNTTAVLPLTASVWDDIQVVPEPGVVTLLLVTAACFRRRR